MDAKYWMHWDKCGKADKFGPDVFRYLNYFMNYSRNFFSIADNIDEAGGVISRDLHSYTADPVMDRGDGVMLDRIKGTMDTWFMMSSVYPTIGLAFIYLMFVTMLGPNLMRSRKPSDLAATLLAYNGAQVVFSLWWLFKMLSNLRAVTYIKNSIFEPNSFIVDEVLEKQIDELGYYYLLSKYVELLDTVFFIFRQKWSQVTFLHVYHHSNMAVTTWFYLKYIWGRHSAVISILNVSVHVVMYTYYLLSSLGPSIRPYLWWKRYITRMQMGQFLILLFYVATLINNRCRVQKTFTYITAANVTSFLILFTNFYLKTYRSKIVNSGKQNIQRK